MFVAIDTFMQTLLPSDERQTDDMTHIYLLFSTPQYENIVTSMRKDDPNVYERNHKLKYDDI